MNLETLWNSPFVIGIIVVMLVILIAAGVLYRRKKTTELAGQCMAVWAAQGPFETGQKSAAAMRAAYQVCLGLEKAEENRDVFRKHAEAYDQDPETWESLRAQSEKHLDKPQAEKVDIAKGFAAMESLNKEYLEEGGHKLEPFVDSDGKLQIAYNQTMSDEEIQQRDKERDDQIVLGLGQGLLSQDTDEGKELVEFLDVVGEKLTDEESRSPRRLGHAYFACLDLKHEDPDDEIAREFDRLSDAASKVTPAPPGEWSETPGAHEEHLLRRRNNPYFPKNRQIVTDEELEQAKRSDIDEYRAVKRRVDTLIHKIDEMAERASFDQLNQLRKQTDGLADDARRIGAIGEDILSLLESLHDAIVQDMRAVMADSAEALEKLDEAERVHKENNRKFGSSVIAQMSEESSPIPSEETIPALVSEPPDALKQALEILPEETQLIVKHHGLEILKEAYEVGYRDPDLEAKIDILSIHEQDTPDQ